MSTLEKCCARCKTPYNCARKSCVCHVEFSHAPVVPEPVRDIPDNVVPLFQEPEVDA